MQPEAYREVEKLLAQIRIVTTNPAIIRASDQIEVLCKSHILPTVPCEVRGKPLTPKEATIFNLLVSREGKVVSKEALMNAAYCLSHDEPDAKVIDVFVHKLRKKLVGSGFHIENLWGSGYKIVKEVGYIPPKQRTSCRYGHPYDDKNTYIDKDGKRKCKACKAAARARYNQKMAQLNAA